MSITAILVEYLADLIEYLGYIGIFILMTLESSGIPIPSEIVVTFAGFKSFEGSFNLIDITLVSTLANLTGSLIFYYIGYRYGGPFVDRYGKYLRLNNEHIDLVKRWFGKYGDISIFIGRITPGVRTYISFPAGLARMNLRNFIILTLIGSIIWNYMLAYAGYVLRDNWHKIIPIIDYIAIIAIPLIIIILYIMWRNKLI